MLAIAIGVVWWEVGVYIWSIIAVVIACLWVIDLS